MKAEVESLGSDRPSFSLEPLNVSRPAALRTWFRWIKVKAGMWPNKLIKIVLQIQARSNLMWANVSFTTFMPFIIHHTCKWSLSYRALINLSLIKPQSADVNFPFRILTSFIVTWEAREGAAFCTFWNLHTVWPNGCCQCPYSTI